MRLQLVGEEGEVLAQVNCTDAKVLPTRPGDVLLVWGVPPAHHDRILALLNRHFEHAGLRLPVLLMQDSVRGELLTDAQAAGLRAALDARAAARALAAATERASEAVANLPPDHELAHARSG